MKKYLYLIKNSKISTYLKYWLMYSSKKISLLIQSLPITLENTIKDLKIVINKIYGNSEQNTTTGKNLLNTINANTTTINGVTSYRNNGFYYLSGTNTKTDATWILPNTQNTNLPVFEIGQTYTMSFKGTLPSGIYAQLNGVKTSTGTQYSIGSVRNTVPSVTFTIDSDYSSTAQLFVGVQGTTTNVDCNFAIQIEKGSTATSYEPYTGGIPSPNPSYPQEITNVTGDVEVVVENKNLFDESVIQIGKTLNEETGTVTIVTSDRNTSDFINVYPNITYVCNTTMTRICLYDKNKAYIGRKDGYLTTKTNITIPNNIRYIKFSYNSSQNNVQLQKGSTSTDYVPHKSQVFTFPLGNEKLMLGDYLADDGIHHVRGQVRLDSLTWSYTSDGNRFKCDNISNLNIKGAVTDGSPSTQILSNIFTVYSNNWIGSNNFYDPGIAITTTGLIRVKYIDTTDVNVFETMLTNKNGILEYELEQEVIVPYTSAQQEVYNQIKQALSYEGQTNISSNQNIYLDIDYIKRG